MKRPLAIDLFCKAGGAAMGLWRAGFDVIGLDIEPQPRYPFTFVRGDALNPPFDLSRTDFIWASPKCQRFTSMRTMHNAKDHPNQIPRTRELLQSSGALYVIENVPGAPLENPFTLCGTMFGLGCDEAQLHRHRIFEANFAVPFLECRHDDAKDVVGVYGGHVRNRRRREGSIDRGVADFSVKQGHEAMGIDWMTLSELSEAIPPAYAEYIGLAARQALLWRRAA